VDDIVKYLFEHLPPGAAWTLAVASLLIVVAPSGVKLWDAWRDTRSGRRTLEEEKQRLELLKLRCEIEALVKQHQLSVGREISAAPAPVPGPAGAAAAAPAPLLIPSPAAAPPSPSLARPRRWAWVERMAPKHPAITRALLRMLTGVTGLLVLFFAILSIVYLVMAISPEPDFPRETALWALAVTLSPVAALSLLVTRIHRQARLLKCPNQ
jgi:hypothetical protein